MLDFLSHELKRINGYIYIFFSCLSLFCSTNFSLVRLVSTSLFQWNTILNHCVMLYGCIIFFYSIISSVRLRLYRLLIIFNELAFVALGPCDYSINGHNDKYKATKISNCGKDKTAQLRKYFPSCCRCDSVLITTNRQALLHAMSAIYIYTWIHIENSVPKINI